MLAVDEDEVDAPTAPRGRSFLAARAQQPRAGAEGSVPLFLFLFPHISSVLKKEESLR